MKRISALFFSFFTLTALFSGCTNKPSAPSGAGGSTKRAAVVSGEMQFSPITPGAPIAIIETNKGDITVVLYPDYAPLAVENFQLLATQSYYDETEFHRVLENFIIQAGDATGTGLGGNSAWGAAFPTEYNENLRHYSGALCMANTGGKPHTNQSQFYILASPQGEITDEIALQMQEAGVRQEIIDAYKLAGGAPYLDYSDTVFGQVYAGMDVVDAISRLATDEDGRPKNPVTILSIKLSTYSSPSSASSAQNGLSGSFSSNPASYAASLPAVPESFPEE